MSRKQVVKTTYANIYREPSFSSEMITQALFFETLEVKSEHDSWLKISQWDGYEGYVHKFYLCDFDKNREDRTILTERLTPIYMKPELISVSMLAPFGSRISCSRNNNNWCNLKLDSLNYYFKAPATMNYPINRDTIISHCDRLMGSPYLWGGKTPFGYDCSGFVQEIFRSVDVNLNRDTSQQIQDSRFPSIDLSAIKRGDIIFFDFEKKGVDHVGIWYGDDQVIHCGGCVKIQSIHDDSHKKLYDYIVEIKSMENYLDG